MKRNGGLQVFLALASLGPHAGSLLAMSTAPPVWVPALARLVRGTVATRADPLFQETISLFNAACHSAAHAVVLVLDADDVSA